MIFIQLIAQGTPADWKEFGLAGMVIFALFVALGFIVRFLLKQVESLMTNHREERNEWRSSDLVARSELTDTLKTIAETHANSFKEVNQELKNQTAALGKICRHGSS